jgi:hypothetical protein
MRLPLALLVLSLLPALALAQPDCVPGEVEILSPGPIAGTFGAGVPDPKSWPADTSRLIPPGIIGNVVVARDPGYDDPQHPADPDEACTPLTNPEEVAGNIALIRRGGCTFPLKVFLAEKAGAIGAIIYNDERVPDDDATVPIYFMGTGDWWGPETPGVIVGRAPGLAMLDVLEAGGSVEAALRYAACYLPVAAEENVIPGTRELSAAHPNPFADRTQFELSLDQAQRVSVSVYNVLGQKVATLHEGALSADTHRFAFEATALPAGVYLIRAEGENFAQTRQVTLVR